MKMKPYAIWLIPEQPYSETISALIDLLSREHDATPFAPHLTLLSGACGDHEEVIGAVTQLCSLYSSVILKVKGINHSKEFFRSLYIEFDGKEQLIKMRTFLQNSINGVITPLFIPHVSLLYKEMVTEKKARIAAKTRFAEQQIGFDRVKVVRPGNEFKGWYDINAWETVKEMRLALPV